MALTVLDLTLHILRQGLHHGKCRILPYILKIGVMLCNEKVNKNEGSLYDIAFAWCDYAYIDQFYRVFNKVMSVVFFLRKVSFLLSASVGFLELPLLNFQIINLNVFQDNWEQWPFCFNMVFLASRHSIEHLLHNV